MKIKLVLSLSLGLLLFISLALIAQKESKKKPEYYKVSKVKIFIKDASEILELRKQGFSIEHIKVYDNYFEAYADSFHLNILNHSIYPYEIIIDDVTKDYLERTKESREKIKLKGPFKTSGFGFGSMGGFYTLDEVIAQLDTMRLLYPNLITAKDSVGSSIEGKTIWAVKISDNPDINENEPEVFYNSLTHAREPGGMMAIIYFMYYLLENYGIDPEVTYLVNNRELYFMPVVNPDGYVYNETISPNGGGMWYKNRRNNGDGSFGVNLNSNFGYQWGYDNIGSSPITTSDLYRGTGPFSEPETQVVRDYCINHNFLIGVNYHTTSGTAYWRVVFPPWGYNLEQTSDSTIYNILIELVTALNHYSNGAGIGRNNGDAADWMYGETIIKNRIFGIIPEIGESNGTNWPSLERILKNCEENLYPNLIYAWGPSINEYPPYISNASLNLRFCRSLIDTVKITAIETNPDNHTSNVFAQLLNLNDSLISEIQLVQSDSIFTGSKYFNVPDENFYKIKFKQSGIDIPSNLFIDSKLRFTTAGPIELDSISIKKSSFSLYNARPYIRNLGTTATINNVSAKLTCSDPWIMNLTTGPFSYPAITPGATVGSTANYSFRLIDSLFPGYYNFKIDIYWDGLHCWTDSIKVITEIDNEVQQPLTFKLEQNFPNPFNPQTSIQYSISSRQFVSLKVYDILGNEIETLVNEEKPAGYYEVTWHAANLPSGVYFYQLRGGGFIETRKMLLLR